MRFGAPRRDDATIYDVIYSGGQSNGEGVNPDPWTPIGPQYYDQFIDQIGNDGLVHTAVEPLLYVDSPPATSHSPAMAFARWYAKNNLLVGHRILIVPLAEGSTSVLMWNGLVPGADLVNFQMKLAAATALPHQDVLYMEVQGERDVRTLIQSPGYTLLPDAATWGAQKITYLTNVQSSIRNNSIPILLSKFSDNFDTGLPQRLAVESVMITSVAPHFGRSGVVVSSGLSVWGISSAHFDNNGIEGLGQRFYNLYLQVR